MSSNIKWDLSAKYSAQGVGKSGFLYWVGHSVSKVAWEVTAKSLDNPEPLVETEPKFSSRAEAIAFAEEYELKYLKEYELKWSVAAKDTTYFSTGLSKTLYYLIFLTVGDKENTKMLLVYYPLGDMHGEKKKEFKSTSFVEATRFANELEQKFLDLEDSSESTNAPKLDDMIEWESVKNIPAGVGMMLDQEEWGAIKFLGIGLFSDNLYGVFYNSEDVSWYSNMYDRHGTLISAMEVGFSLAEYVKENCEKEEMKYYSGEKKGILF